MPSPYKGMNDASRVAYEILTGEKWSPMEKISIDTKLVWKAERTHEENLVAVCAPLKLVATGSSFSELTSVISEILNDWIKTRIRSGDLEETLTALEFQGDLGIPPLATIPERFFVDASFELQMA